MASASEVPGKWAKLLWGLEMEQWAERLLGLEVEPGEEEEQVEVEPGEGENQVEEVTVWAAVISEVCKK